MKSHFISVELHLREWNCWSADSWIVFLGISSTPSSQNDLEQESALIVIFIATSWLQPAVAICNREFGTYWIVCYLSTDKSLPLICLWIVETSRRPNFQLKRFPIGQLLVGVKPNSDWLLDSNGIHSYWILKAWTKNNITWRRETFQNLENGSNEVKCSSTTRWRYEHDLLTGWSASFGWTSFEIWLKLWPSNVKKKSPILSRSMVFGNNMETFMVSKLTSRKIGHFCIPITLETFLNQ